MKRRKSKLTLATLCGVHALHDGLVDMLYALLPLLREAFGLTYAEVALIRAANKTAMAVFQIPAGLWAERIGERTLLALGTGIAGMSAAWLLAQGHRVTVFETEPRVGGHSNTVDAPSADGVCPLTGNGVRRVRTVAAVAIAAVWKCDDDKRRLLAVNIESPAPEGRRRAF